MLAQNRNHSNHDNYQLKLRNAYNISIGKPEEKRSLRRPRHRWEDNTRMDIREIGGKVLSGFVLHMIEIYGGLL
jgi:hypothetical protein